MGTYSDLLKSKPTIIPEPISKVEDSSLSPLKESNIPTGESETQPTERFSERKNERVEPNLSSFPYKRRTKRYSFEFYDDQILAIKRLVYEANVSGENISQSDIVRAALDKYLKETEND